MTIAEIKYFIERFLKTKPYVVGNQWVMTNCPFARATHSDKDDKKFSFGISVNNAFHCFTCSEKGHIRNIPLKLWKYFKNHEFLEMSMFIEKVVKTEHYRKLGEHFYILDKETEEKYKEEEKNEHNNTEKLQMFYNMYPLPEYIKEYKTLHFISEDIEKWDIRYNFLDQTILFPIFNKNKQLINVKARKQLSDGRKIFYFWCKGNKTEWYGVHLLSNKSKYLFLVEGERDAIFLSRYVENVFASMGMPTIDMINRLPLDKKIILFFDNDMTGEKITQKVLKYVASSNVYIIRDYEVKDPAEVVENNMFEQVINKSIKKVR